MTLVESIGLALRREREARQLTQRDLAAAAELHPMALSKIECGKRHGDIGVVTLTKLCNALTVTGRPCGLISLLETAAFYRRGGV